MAPGTPVHTMEAHTLELTLAAGTRLGRPGAHAGLRRDRSLTSEDGQVETLRLLVSEVVTNAVRHGSATRPWS